MDRRINTAIFNQQEETYRSGRLRPFAFRASVLQPDRRTDIRDEPIAPTTVWHGRQGRH